MRPQRYTATGKPIDPRITEWLQAAGLGDAHVLDLIDNEELAAMTPEELAAYHAILGQLRGR